MPYTPVASGLYTTVENTSGAPAVFGFLGVQGRRLEANETYTVRGDLVAALGALRSPRKFKGLERALLAGDIKIVSSPAVYLYDETDEETHELAADNGALGVIDPRWDPDGIGESAFA